jgi:uncharacterized repeat protein (TIGR03803 family)
MKAAFLGPIAMLVFLGSTCSATPPANVVETVLYTFQGGNDGADPAAGVILDKTGNLYGTTDFGGGGSGVNCSGGVGCGTVFELTPSGGGAWTETVLHAFQAGNDGAQPLASLVIDSAGNLYGTTADGGSQCNDGLGCGTVFEVSPPAQPGSPWTEAVLYTFQNGSDGRLPVANLVLDRAGNLYGTTELGGSTACGGIGCGIIFEVSPPSQSSGVWTEKVLYSFQGGSDGAEPAAGLVFDNEGALYGTTGEGGSSNEGTVFQLKPPSSPGGSWTESVLFSFNGTDGGGPYADLIFDKKGNLYGTTVSGGPLSCPNGNGKTGCGTVFELSPPSQPGGSWIESVLYNFKGPGSGDGRFPLGSLILDVKGNLYGTTSEGAIGNDGTVFELMSPASPGGAWTKRQFTLSSSDGGSPAGGLVFGPGVAVTGTGAGGFFAGGTVFSIGP